MKPNNPFLITGYHSPAYFCDREQETATVLDALRNGRNLTLISPRRMGKTGLIKNVFYKEKNAKTLYMDIYSTQNLGDFVRLFGSTVLGSLDTTSQKVMHRIGQFFKSCRPVFTFDEMTGAPQVTIDILPSKEEATLKEIFGYLRAAEQPCIIAIDEFQQIAEYPEKGVEALLRSYIQFAPGINFIFAGSQQHVMQEMFLTAKHPFFQSTQILSLGSIDREQYFRFAARFFEEAGYDLPQSVFEALYDEFDGHTWYIQDVLNRLYGYRREPTRELLGEAVAQIVAESEYSFQALTAAYSTGAVRLLKAIAKSRIVPEITAGDFITTYKLRAPSSVMTALKTLLKKEMVYKTPEGYIVYDRFLAIWLRNQSF